MMLSSLKDPAIAPIAALAFQDVCEDCAEQLSCFSGQLMTACRVSVQCNSSSNRSPYRIQCK